ncbi:all-trans-retinol 13,14-reductase-like [Hydractinia symbiolongicarpus]|uniref:all-trans-retinol 13,14-reductase-like n=1 Tax=Hydractinia symbiolongicarpus TaxID=13093 RepID=UPI00254E294C|nr:all-trans-retinol 13,14-reductase-like [Hydractinia symbiolongicarpus]
MAIVNKLFFHLLSFMRSQSVFNLIVIYTVATIIIWRLFFKKKRGPNPFSKECIRPRRPLVVDKEKRDAVIKQGFTGKKIPKDIDVIVVGSGIGGLSCAALLAKAGKKVLVLEQHDQAGGCCHTFIEKGYEFDVGIHYIGEVHGNTLTQTFIDQITEGQLGWAPVEDVIDRVELGVGDDNTSHDVLKGRENWKQELKNKFPNEHDAIDKFFCAMKKARRLYPQTFLLKMLPLSLVNVLLKTGIFNLLSDLPKYINKSTGEFLDELTSNKRLKAALCYSFGDYGTQPRESPILMQLMLLQHYTHGGYYPIGGSSEIAFNIIPVIEKNGGKVLVRANVTQILIDENGKANGVSVNKGGEDFKIYAPMVISAAGYINTFENLVPDSVKNNVDIQSVLKKVQSGWGAISIFVGLDGTNEELNLKATNTWAMAEIDLDKGVDEFLSLPAEKAGESDIPLLFISFPSTKDPTWNERYPGKSNCTIVTLVNWEWFQNWKDERVMKRGESYDELKMRIGEKAWEQTLKFYPQLKGKRKYFDVGTPLSNKYYIASPKGEIYGLDHTLSRFDLSVSARLRASTPVPGLYLTGQDVSTCGFAGALYAGLLTASTVLNRNLINDLIAVKKEVKREASKKKD